MHAHSYTWEDLQFVSVYFCRAFSFGVLALLGVHSRGSTASSPVDDFLKKNDVQIVEPVKLDISDEVRNASLLLSVTTVMIRL